jgi:hypothetical protein
MGEMRHAPRAFIEWVRWPPPPFDDISFRGAFPNMFFFSLYEVDDQGNRTYLDYPEEHNYYRCDSQGNDTGIPSQYEWPSTAFKSYLCQKYDLAQDHPAISGPILYGGQPLEDLDWNAEPVMEITEFACQVLELALFDDVLK